MKAILIFIILILLAGCVTVPVNKETIEVSKEEAVIKAMFEYSTIGVVCYVYREEKNKWPLALEELEDFIATKKDDSLLDIKLAKYSNVTFECLEDDSLEVAYNAHKHPLLKQRMSVVIPPPGSDKNMAIHIKD